MTRSDDTVRILDGTDGRWFILKATLLNHGHCVLSPCRGVTNLEHVDVVAVQALAQHSQPHAVVALQF